MILLLFLLLLVAGATVVSCGFTAIALIQTVVGSFAVAGALLAPCYCCHSWCYLRLRGSFRTCCCWRSCCYWLSCCWWRSCCCWHSCWPWRPFFAVGFTYWTLYWDRLLHYRTKGLFQKINGEKTNSRSFSERTFQILKGWCVL
jgi:hypothetical protein